MKPVTQNFLDAQASPAPVMIRQVWYKRRYWIASSKQYFWETGWTLVPENNVVSVSAVTWQLDTQTLNEYKTSNVTVTLENLSNQWTGTNPYGIFGKDAGSPVYGYEPYWTKFQVRAGLTYGTPRTTEVVNIFTGLATDYNLDSGSGAMQVTLTGDEALLVAANAEGVSTAIVGETATGTVNGTNKDFTTAHNGVGLISEVSDNGISLRAGIDFSLAQLNDPLHPGKVSFNVAPSSGHIIRVSYLYWFSTQKFETLVTALVTKSGIAPASQSVSPVIFPSNIINTHVWQTQADWQGGSSLTNIDTTTLIDSVKLDFLTADSAQTTSWGGSLSGWSTLVYAAGNFSDSGGNLHYTQTAINGVPTTGSMYRVQGGVIGSWKFSIKPVPHGSRTYALFYFLVANVTRYTPLGQDEYVGTNGYSIGVSVDADYHVTLYKHSSTSDPATNATIIASYTMPAPGSSAHTISVTRFPKGRIIVYYDGISVIDVVDTTYTKGGWLCILQGASTPSTYYFGDSAMLAPSATKTATWISQAIDFSARPTAWTQLRSTVTLSGGTITYYTASSADNITYDSYVLVPSSGAIASTLRRYLKVKAVLSCALTANNDPTLTSITVGAITGSTNITLANFTGMTCYDAITLLANFANYEFGFDADETFFFRPKHPGTTPVFTISADTFALRLSSLVNGYDRVYSNIRASYGGYIRDIADDGATFNGPLKKTGYNLLEIDGGNLLISADADVATGLAKSFFGYYNQARRRVKIQTKIIPQLDISDVVAVDFQDSFPDRWYIGDTSAAFGDSTKSLYGPDEQILPPTLMKVIGMRIDTNAWQTEFDLEEVLP